MVVYINLPRLRKATTQTFFCSRTHANEWQARNKIAYTCKICGVLFHKSASFEKFGRVLYCSHACRYADPDKHAQLLAMNADQQRRQQTEIERIGYQLLNDLCIRYEPQYMFAGKFCVDAFLLDHQIVIQFDGDYWHGNPTKFLTLDARQQKRMGFDRSQDAYMATCGYRVIRMWETDLKHHLDQVRHDLLQALH